MVSFILGISKPFFKCFTKITVGITKLTNKRILQSSGICKKLNKTSKKGIIPRPIPTLIMFLSRKLLELVRKKVKVNPNP